MAVGKFGWLLLVLDVFGWFWFFLAGWLWLVFGGFS